jgi:hypothetical protein
VSENSLQAVTILSRAMEFIKKPALAFSVSYCMRPSKYDGIADKSSK